MTKIKTTKKGMAKKTLSMSLVLAMLATSNVPVWAADFSDGTDAAVEAEAEAPAVDATEEFSDDAADVAVQAAEAEAPAVEENTESVENAQKLPTSTGLSLNVNDEVKLEDLSKVTAQINSIIKELLDQDGWNENMPNAQPTEGAESFRVRIVWRNDTTKQKLGELPISSPYSVSNYALPINATFSIGDKIAADAYIDKAEGVYNKGALGWGVSTPKAPAETKTFKVIANSAEDYYTAPEMTLAETAKVGDVLTAPDPQEINGATVSYQWYKGTTSISGATDAAYKVTDNDLGCKISVKISVNTNTTTYGTVDLGSTNATTIVSENVEDYINADELYVRNWCRNGISWNDSDINNFFSLYGISSDFLEVKDAKYEPSLSVKKDGKDYTLKGTTDDIGAVITPVIKVTVPGVDSPLTYTGETKSVKVVDADASYIGLEDQQWKDSITGELLERGKMPEYTYENDSKVTYRPVLAKVWVGGKEYSLGDQNVEATHDYENITKPGTYWVSVDLTTLGIQGTIWQEYEVKAKTFKETDVTYPSSLTYAPGSDLEKAAVEGTSVSGLTKFDGDNEDKAQYKVTVSTSGNKATITVTGMNEYAGTSFKKEVKIEKYNLANAYVAPIEDQAYTGSDVRPAITVKYNTEKGTVLTETTDYTVTYQQNRDAGTATIILTGTGMCEGTKTVTFNIVSKAFSTRFENAVNQAINGITYNAKEQRPVDKDLGGLKYLSDFSTSYVNNVDAGTATVTIKGAGNYAGASLTKTFTIGKANLSDIPAGSIVVEDTTYSKDLATELGKTIKPSVTVKFNGTTVREGIDYDIEYTGVAGSAGSRTVSITLKETKAGNSNFKGSKVISGKVISKDLNTVTIPSIPSQVYTGNEYTLDNITLSDGTLFKDNIKDGKVALTNQDYYVSAYRNNVNTGTATMLLAGKGDYKGTVTVTFPIDAQEMNAKFVYVVNGTDFDGVPDLPYNYSKAQSKNGITHTDGEFRVVLTENSGSDEKGETVDPDKYTIKYTENKAVGTATIEAVGKDGYSLNAKTTFKITPQVITEDQIKSSVSVNDNGLYYTGEEQKAKVTVNYTADGYKLVEGTDFEVSYADNIAATDKAKVTIKGLGNYVIGSEKNEGITKEFNIQKATIANNNVTVKDVAYAGGLQITPDITIVNPYSGKELVQGTDYTVSVKDNTTEVGTATAEVALTSAGKVNYTLNGADTMTFRFNITAKDLADVTIAPISDQVATGEQIKPAVTVMNGNTKLTEGTDYEVVYGDNKEVGEGTVTVKALDSNKNYTGSQTVKFNIVENKTDVGTPEIASAAANGNKAVVTLAGEVKNATAYDYVISADNDLSDEEYVAELDGQVATEVTFAQLEQGSYYAFCRAWTRDENGKKVYGEWSEGKEFEVTAVTPETPEITEVSSYEKNGSYYVTVTYTASANAEKYGIILGTKQGKDSDGQIRPLNYGTMKKNNVNADKTTVTFKVPKKGTYYAGLRAYNKSGENGKKVYSNWSNVEPVSVPEKSEE